MVNNSTLLNESRYIVSNGRLLEIEQGPRPLVELLYSPPGWLPPVLTGLLLVGLVGVAVGLWRRGLSRETAEEMLWNGSIVGGVTVASMVVPSLVAWPYLWDVVAVTLVGIPSGWAVAWLAIEQAEVTAGLGGGPKRG